MSLCVFIGEGKSEGIFLQQLLQNNLNFQSHNPKHPIFFGKENSDKYWLLAHPRLGQRCRAGKPLLEKKDTFQNCIPKVNNHLRLIPRSTDIHYRILRDLDHPMDETSQEKIRQKILVAANPWKVSNSSNESIHVSFCNRELESWFIASLHEESPLIHIKNRTEILNLLRENPDEIHQPKERLNTILSPEYQDSEPEIAYLFGNNFDIKRAYDRSASFREFYDSLTKFNLI